ncbi:MAG TPA: BTAD domain-containing putative transcriptional regulator, partial [Actinomycetota bacterium]
MQFRVLGPLEVDAGDGPIPLGGPKQRAVLANLLVRANQVVPADTLIDGVWGEEPPEQARNTLQTYVSNLRRTLGEDRLQGRDPGYVLLLDPFELDSERFDSLVRDAKRALSIDPGVAITTLDDALALWRGPALADLADRPSLLAEAARLDERRLEAQEDRVEGLMANGDHARAVGEIEALLPHHPLREGLWSLLMLALYRDGRQADALTSYQRARELLADELGIDPSPELGRLHERILRQDPGLDLKGEALRGYRLLEKLGEGPDATVFRAIQPHVERDVAAKVFNERISGDAAFVQRFESSAQAAASLEHPHIVPIYDYWREPGRAYIVSRYLRGGNLLALQGSGPVDPELAATIVQQVGSALALAHARGIAHGNLVATNVLLDAESNAYVGDFSVRSAGSANVEDDLRGLAGLVGSLFGDRTPTRLAELCECVDRDEIPDAAAFVEATRSTLEPSAPSGARREDIRNPYKGLRPFTEADSGDFFGRGALVRRLVEGLNETGPDARFLAIVGPSGGGKSSIVRAGLMPAIRQGALAGAHAPFVSEMFPGNHPLEELEAALLRVAVRPAPRLRDLLERGSRGLLEAIALILPEDGELVLVVDQFEEAFTITTSAHERASFLELLRVACVDPESRVRVIVTMRADFYDRPLTFPRFGELLAARTQALPPLTPDELEQAIRRPAERVGVRPEPGMIAELIADVAHQPGALPLVQYALTELFERRDDDVMTLDRYREIGGVAGALSARAEHLYRGADTGWRSAVRQAFLRLVTLGEGRPDTRRRVARSELDSLDVEPATIDDVLDTFGRHRLLTFDREPSNREPTVEISHEALLSAWERLRSWIDEAREDLRQERGLARAATEWVGSDRDPSFLLTGARLDVAEQWAASTDLAIGRNERVYLKASIDERMRERAIEDERREHEVRLEQRSKVRLRALVAVFAVAALIAGSLTIVATSQSEKADDAARISHARSLAAASIASLEEDPERGVLLAIEAAEETRALDGSVLPEAIDALHRSIAASRIVLTVPHVDGAIAWGPLGVFAVASEREPGVIELRTEGTGDLQLAFAAHDGTITGLAFSPDGSMLVSTGADGDLDAWDPSEGALLWSISGRAAAVFPAFSEDGTIVTATWTEEGSVRVVDPTTGEQLMRIGGLVEPPGAAPSPDGTQVAVFGIRLYRVDGVDVAQNVGRIVPVPDLGSTQRGRAVRFEVPIWEGTGSVAWSPDGSFLASDDIPYIWDARTGRRRYQVLGHINSVTGIDWHPTRDQLITGGYDGTVRLWHIEAGSYRELMTLSSGGNPIEDVTFSPDGSQVMATDAQRTLRIWDIGPSGDAELGNMPQATVGGVQFLSDGRLVGRAQTRLITVDPATGREGTLVDGLEPPDGLYHDGFSFSPDEDLLETQSRSIVTVRDGSDGAPRFVRPTSGEVTAWTSDGSLALADDGGGITLYDPSGDRGQTFRSPELSITAVSIGDRGRLMAVAGGVYDDCPTPQVIIWNLETGREVRRLPTCADTVAMEPDGPTVVTTGLGAPTLWDASTGARLGAFPLSGDSRIATFSPDGSTVAFGGLETVV